MAFYLLTFFLTFFCTFFVPYLPTWGPAGNTWRGYSRLRSGREHWAWMVVGEVRQGTLGGDGRGWGPAGNTGRGYSRLRSGREHCGSRVAVEPGRRGRRGRQGRQGWANKMLIGVIPTGLLGIIIIHNRNIYSPTSICHDYQARADLTIVYLYTYKHHIPPPIWGYSSLMMVGW